MNAPAAGALVVWLAAALAQDSVRVTGLDGKVIAGDLRGLDAQGRLVLATSTGDVAFPVDELREVAPAAASPVELPAAGLVMLWSGQTLRGTVRGVQPGAQPDGAGSALRVDVAPARAPLVLPLRTIRALRISEEPQASGDGFDEALRGTASKDLLFHPRFGRLSVVIKRLVEIDGDVQVVVEFDGKEQRPKSLRELYGVVFGQGAAPDAQPGARVTAQIAGGPSFTGSLRHLDPAADRCVLRLDEGCDLDLPWRHVARLTVRSDRLVYLSEIEPVSVEQTPALTRKWAWLRDRAPLGPGIVLRGETFARGLVLVPRTKLVYDIGGRFDRFEASVGIDDRAATIADAVIRVIGDDKVLFEAAHVRRGALPYPVRVAVKGVRRLALETDFGDNLDLSDHCAFAEARVLRDG